MGYYKLNIKYNNYALYNTKNILFIIHKFATAKWVYAGLYTCIQLFSYLN